MSSARRASNPDCHNRERVLSPRGVQRSTDKNFSFTYQSVVSVLGASICCFFVPIVVLTTRRRTSGWTVTGVRLE